MRPFDQLDRRGFVAAPQLETGTAALLWLVILVLLMVGACSTTAPAPQPAVDLPRYVAPSAAKPARVALVLSGGSARGFAHIGVLRVLEREGLRPDLVVGTSVGAIIGGLYASGLSVGAIEALGEQLNWFTVFDIDPVDSILSGLGLGLAKGKRLEAFLRRAMHAPMHLFPTQFAAVATDLNSGQTVVLNYGDAALAMRASSAIPGMLEPVEIGGRLLGDGQIVSPMPVEVARQLGARVVIAVDVVYPPQQSNLTSPVSVLFQTMVISSWRHLQSQRQQADLVLSPVIEVSGQPGLSDRVWLIKAGIAAAEAGLPQLKAVLSGRRMERL